MQNKDTLYGKSIQGHVQWATEVRWVRQGNVQLDTEVRWGRQVNVR